MNFGLQCLAIALLASATAFAEDLGERATGYRFPRNPHRVVSKHSGLKRTLLKSGNSTLPEKWDSREHGWITPVRDQGNLNTCWTFAAYATLEAQLLKAGRGEHDFSEKNMANLDGYELEISDGGNTDMAAAYLLRWGGAIAETNDVYKTTKASWTNSMPMNPAIHVHDVVWLPALKCSTDNDTLKAAIMDYGAVFVSMYFGESYHNNDVSGAYYCSKTAKSNHAVTAIGWDDNYSRTNFTQHAEADGAWIIKNSYGSNSGSNGYYYVSYYDKNFGKDFDKDYYYYPADIAVFIPASEGDGYTAVYGYDKLGRVGDCTNGYDLAAAVFTSAWNEEVAAIGVYSFSESQDYSVEVYTNVTKGADSPIKGGNLAYSQDGTLTHAGYTTIRLEEPVKLADGTNFAVVYRQKGDDPKHAMDYSSEGYSISNHSQRETFLGNSSTGKWKDATSITGLEYQDYGAKPCVCLKAYTRSTVSAGDGPEEYNSGVKMLTALATTNATLYAETGETFGAFANIVGANGRTLWASWLAGFDPANKDDNKLVVDISVTNNVPYLSWTPNLGADRNYRIWGTETLAEENWQEVDDLKKTDAKFFKVTVEQ